MEDGCIVQRLVEILAAFFIEKRTVKEDLTYSLTSKFLQNMQDVLYTKQVVSYVKFQDFFADGFEKMLSSPKMYLMYVFFACQQENFINLKTFEKFLSVFALILRISIETRSKSRMDFYKLAPDIFRVFYEKELEPLFEKRGGFRRFVEFVNNPKYLESKCFERNITCDCYELAYGFPKTSLKKMKRMVQEEPSLDESFNFSAPEVDPKCRSLAEEVLKIINTKSILLPNDDDLMLNLSHSIQQEITPLNEKSILEAPKEAGASKSAFESSPREILNESFKEVGVSNLNFESTSILSSDSKTNDDAAVQKEDDGASKEVGILKFAFESCPVLSSDSKTNDDAVVQNSKEQCEKILEAINRKNNSKSCHLNSKVCIHTKGDKILENLKSNINSLIQVLDENDKE